MIIIQDNDRFAKKHKTPLSIGDAGFYGSLSNLRSLFQ
jgi:hypothetical protein